MHRAGTVASGHDAYRSNTYSGFSIVSMMCSAAFPDVGAPRTFVSNCLKFESAH
ncbi:hypothetical protein OH687_27145 [Burkholderia anthina]|nr:hypothetical protein OH687_27145 [Burkholderia anthina]